MNLPRPRNLLVAILLLYLALGILFAVYTPAWQAPDEPAHYNYVRYLAEIGRFPVLHMGDYPHAYLEKIKSRGFPPDLSIDPIRYEYHQPPLYYALAAPIYALTGGNLLALRLFSVLLGAGIVLLAYAVARRIFPNRPALTLGTAAFVAFLPQHLATASQVGNDVLAELLFALVLFQLTRWIVGRGGPLTNAESVHIPSSDLLKLGVLLGLILITKTTAYIAVPLAGGVLVWLWWRERADARCILTDLALVVGPAMLVALPWYVRDVWVYDWPDFLGLMRHDAIVVGQLRTPEYLARYGWGNYLQRLVEFTFKSFWGVFGWLGVFMDSRVYLALAIFCGVVASGLILHERRVRRSSGALQPGQRYALRLLAASALLTVLVYGWYNMQFVQHQGRYLFTALIPIAIAFGLGWEEALRPLNSRRLAAGVVLLAMGLVAWGLASGVGLPKWPLTLTLAAAAGLAIRPWLPRQLDALLFALPYLALPFLALYALFGAIVAQLA